MPMTYFESIILGILQALTEFLPVSSSGHLVIAHRLGLSVAENELAFDVALHVGTLAALVLFFWSDIKKLLAGMWKPSPERTLASFLAVGTIPAIIIGVAFERIIEQYFRGLGTLIPLLIFFGALLIAAEKWGGKLRGMETLSWKDALSIGMFQSLALFPGVSRSGATIIAGMSLGLKREDAVRFGFLLGIPAIALAGLKKSWDLTQAGVGSDILLLMAIGAATSAVVGFFVIKYFLHFTRRYPLTIFGVYRILLGFGLLLWAL
ncbi:MAG: undecaprenyl-diphosphatase [Parcubacteria group bacterium CG08_land_8_20_14_0_20_48_21]|nr:MAG: undecaprenyl-diphosphatase [Parcubacteria group bacterium CG08_land_8_20_14_0_20_48_21]PIW79112.1 MAG: undecaprenyl-diphosphatase [Parcubacteria group bacterium CG_4_8_14_3_um_filter_48_16]PIY78209.1 MAG: undecaprenyl-diphosphatase [Parcubacteria group bacterium CG_4_10_14_0_8_um_filter_48_154]PIZ78055.1 MAG: undecaprenyl-diphosphatase [bacterium CG_4_10_14_0_2_um_filter_48_144]PJC40093.1 MAG: undecaprenyl-diphosphatase [Parcubacteria group bacterium CG_4_9_14_0_2_um_filter_48_40]PJE52